MDEPKKEVCSITLMFPVESDEQALDIKAKVKEITKDIKDVRCDFRITGVTG